MKNKLVSLLLAGSLFFSCDGPKLIEPNTESEVTRTDSTIVLDTTYTEPDTTIVPADTTIIPPDTLIIPPDTLIIPPDTIITPPDTTIIPPDTTIITPPDTTIIPPDTLIIPPDTTIIPPDTTINDTTIYIPVDRNDLIMQMEVRRAELGEVLEYTGKLQTICLDTVKINNRNLVGAVKYTLFKEGLEYASRTEHADLLICLYKNGYLQNETEYDSVLAEISNARISGIFQGKEVDYNIPFPIKAKVKSERTRYEEERIKETGNYNFEVGVDYSVLDTLYNVTFVSEEFGVGSGLGKFLNSPIPLKMRIK